MSKHTIYKNLSCDLTREEVATYSEELAKVTSQQAEIEGEKKEIMSDFTAKLNKCIADSRVLARKITTRKEDRHVECDLDFDYIWGMVYTVRADTGQTIDQRKLTDDERQEKLDFNAEQDLKDEATVQVETAAVVEASKSEEITICANTACSHYEAEEPNGCTECENVYECDQVRAVAVV